MSDLRTRIATAIRREVPCHPPAADRIADAVIRELQLTVLGDGIVVGAIVGEQP